MAISTCLRIITLNNKKQNNLMKRQSGKIFQTKFQDEMASQVNSIEQTKFQDEMASQVNSIKHLKKR